MKNAINWFEIPTTDFERGVKFYNTILNTQMHTTEMGDGLMAFLPSEQGALGGAVVKFPHQTPSDKGTMVYLNGGDDLSEILARVEPAGGKIVLPKTIVTPEIGYCAVFRDSEGNHVAIHSPK
jgi:predicted enzyme related to lactoylglutathione lyase